MFYIILYTICLQNRLAVILYCFISCRFSCYFVHPMHMSSKNDSRFREEVTLWLYFSVAVISENTLRASVSCIFFRQHSWREIQLSLCSLAITASPTAHVPGTTCWRRWFFLFSTPFSFWWGCHSMPWLCGCFFASPRSLTSLYTWRISWLRMSLWPSHSLSRFDLTDTTYF